MNFLKQLFLIAVVIPQTLTISLRDEAKNPDGSIYFPKRELAKFDMEGEYIRGPDLESSNAPTWKQKDGPNAIWGILKKTKKETKKKQTNKQATPDKKELQIWLIGSKAELGKTSCVSNSKARGFQSDYLRGPDGASWRYYDGGWRTGIVVHSGKP